MKQLNKIFVLAYFILLFSKCSSDSDNPDYYFSALVDGKSTNLLFSEAKIILDSTTSSSVLMIYGVRSDMVKVINFTLEASSIKAGTYYFFHSITDSIVASASYINDSSIYSTHYNNSIDSSSFLQITDISSTFVKGKFAFKAVNKTEQSLIIEIEDGSFCAKINK